MFFCLGQSLIVLQPCCLKQIIVAFSLGSLILRVVFGYARRKTEAPALVDFGQFPCNVVVESVECNHHRAYARRLTQEPAFGECVRLQEAILESPDSLLLIHVVSIQRAQVKIRRVLDPGVVNIIRVE